LLKRMSNARARPEKQAAMTQPPGQQGDMLAQQKLQGQQLKRRLSKDCRRPPRLHKMLPKDLLDNQLPK
jgi:hypothetical protein